MELRFKPIAELAFSGGRGTSLGGYTASGGYFGRSSPIYNLPGDHQDPRYNRYDGYSTFDIGASAGFGWGGFYTNAECVEQLSGPFDTWTLDIGFWSIQGAIDNETGIYTIGAAITRGVGLNFSRYMVTTTSASTWWRR